MSPKMVQVLIHFLKAIRALFGSDNFMKALNEVVSNRQARLNDKHDERKAIREEKAKADLLKKKRKTMRQERKLKRKEK